MGTRGATCSCGRRCRTRACSRATVGRDKRVLQRSVGRSIAAPGLCSMRVKLCVCTTSLRVSPFVRGHYGTSVPCHRCWLDRSGRSFLYTRRLQLFVGFEKGYMGFEREKESSGRKYLKQGKTHSMKGPSWKVGRPRAALPHSGALQKSVGRARGFGRLGSATT